MSINKTPNFLWCLLLIISSAHYAAAQDSTTTPSSPPDQYGLKANFNPSMAIIIVVLISAFFFMGFFSIYIRQCAGDQTDLTVRPTTGATARSRRGVKGLDPSVIETFPTFVYSAVKELKIGKATLECAVCLNEFEDEETLRLLPKCDHVFHPECIDAWLASHVTCPVCRANLVPDSTENTAEATQNQTSDSEANSDSDHHQNRNNLMSVTVVADETVNTTSSQPDVINPNQIPNRPPRSRSIKQLITGKFPRSHSTGHSVIQPGQNCERFTLRLPEDIRRQIVNGKLNRTTSCVAIPAGYEDGGSSRRGYRGGSVNEGSSRGRYNKFWRLDSKAKSDRWVFSMAPPFFTRTGSVRDDGEGSVNGNGNGNGNPKSFMTSVKSFKSCLNVKVDGGEQSSSSRPPV